MRFFSWDYVFATILLFVIMLLSPIILGMDMFAPIMNSLSDLKMTDIVDSKIVPREHLDADTNMIIINTEINNQNIPNSGLAKLIHKISQYNPKVIGINKTITMSNSERANMMLGSVIANNDNIILASKFDNFNLDTDEFDTLITSDDLFADESENCFTNFMKAEDERFHSIRKFMPVMEYDGESYKSFAYRIAELYNPKAAKKLLERENDNEFIFFRGQYHFFRIEASDIMQDNFLPELIENKIVLLGRISTKNDVDSNMVIKDVYFSPLNDTYTGKSFPDIYGTILHANIISMILNEEYIDSMPQWLIYIFAVMFIYLNNMIFTYIVVKNKKWYEILSLGVFVVESIIILIAIIVGFVFFRYELDLTLLIFAIAMSIIIFELYNSSLKPLTIKMYYKYLHKG